MGLVFDVCGPSEQAECGRCSGEGPAAFVARMARQKASDVAARLREPALVIACDTVALCAGTILGKPHDVDAARAMLQLLSGRRHQVLSGLCLMQVPNRQTRVATDITHLVMDPIPEEELERYLETGLWEGKAGAFGYQDGPSWLRVQQGSESNVVGLPTERLAQMLADFGIASDPTCGGRWKMFDGPG